MIKSEKLGLNLTTTDDTTTTFREWRKAMSDADLVSNMEILDREVGALKEAGGGSEPGEWITPTILFPFNADNLSYRKNNGRVEFTGYFSYDGEAGVVFNLPEGFRPPLRAELPIHYTVDGEATACVIISATPEGEVIMYAETVDFTGWTINFNITAFSFPIGD